MSVEEAIEFIKWCENARQSDVLVFDGVAKRRHYSLVAALYELTVDRNVWTVFTFTKVMAWSLPPTGHEQGEAAVAAPLAAFARLGEIWSPYVCANSSTEASIGMTENAYLVVQCSAGGDLGTCIQRAVGNLSLITPLDAPIKGVIVYSLATATASEQLQILQPLVSPGVTLEIAETCEVDCLLIKQLATPAATTVAETEEMTLSRIFILAGQSNMSGRGDITEVAADAMHTDGERGGYYFDPRLGWLPVSSSRSILHKNVDLLKAAGLGIGNFFVERYLCAEQEAHEPAADGGTVGLVPVAVGATALSEWMPEHVDVNFTPRAYHSGTLNIFSCALRSIHLALRSRKGASSGIAGILWYQGENDAGSTREDAESYEARFKSFLAEFRMAIHVIQTFVGSDTPRHGPKQIIPVVTTAITTTRRAMLENVCIVRIAQLRLRADPDILFLEVVDPLGCGLRHDCIHLTTKSLALVAGEMARKMVHLLHAESAGEAETADGYSMDILVGNASFLDSDYDSHCANLFALARSHAVARAQLQLEHKPKAVSKSSILQSGLRPVNFVRGDVYFLDFARALKLAATFVSTDGGVFVDLGCGVGSCLAAASFITREAEGAGGFVFSHVCGLDLSHAKTLECSLLIDAIQAQKQTTSQVVEVVEANFLSWEGQWEEKASVVYICATCFADDVMEPLRKKLLAVRPGCLVMLVDQELTEPPWEMVANCQVNATWGLANVRIYIRN